MGYTPFTVDVSVKKRFWAKVQKSDSCWIWTGSVNNKGYAQLRVGGTPGKLVLASRVSFKIAHGKIDDELCILHSCDNPHCVCPSHLSQGTHVQNGQDMKVKGRAGWGELHGEANPTAKFDHDLILKIRNLYESGHTQMRIRAMTGVSQSHISRIVRCETRTEKSLVNVFAPTQETV